MDNNTPKLNRKQEELVKRLEEIRQKQNEQDRKHEADEASMTKRSLEQSNDSQSQAKKRHQRKRKRTTMQPDSRSLETKQKKNRPLQQRKKSDDWVPSYLEESSESTPAQDSTAECFTTSAIEKQSTGEHLIEQLTEGERLTEAIVLSEILSKPVAFRKRYR